MKVLDADAVEAALAFEPLVAALAQAFAGGVTVPTRHHHEVLREAQETATMLLMPAWTTVPGNAYLGTKIVNVFPDNGSRGLPSVMGIYVLMSGETGAPLCVLDGARLTAWRTAAASALASKFLSRPESARLLMVGAGALAPYMVRAHASLRPIRHVTLWNHTPARANTLASILASDAFEVTVTQNLEAAANEADIICCATLSSEPVVKGLWLKPGAHLDLVGAFRPTMRESDDAAVRRARLFVDTRAGAMKEGGDISQPLAAGIITADKIEADLFDLCGGTFNVNRKAGDITLFKSVGTAIEDLAAAMLVWKHTTP
jgi:alanine dehydrogenase